MLVGLDLSEQQLDQVALGFHYGLAIFWAPIYGLLRRIARMRPIPAALITRTAMSVLADELMTPAFGFSAQTWTTRWPRTCAGSPHTWCSGGRRRGH